MIIIMSRKPIRIISVGKVRTKHWQMACEHYLTRLNHWYTTQETIIQDANSSLSALERSNIECKNIIEKLNPNNVVICLDEGGKSMTSRSFASFFQQQIENANTVPCFIIGGAYGLTDELRKKAKFIISLGAITLPHELARVILLEQLYRAGSIIRNLPYHHD